jgi:cobaltochelatase CobS
LMATTAGVKPMLVGPAGSGKTTACRQVAKALGLAFHFTGSIDSPHHLTGYQDAAGNYHRTPFREAFEFGGVFLFDEIDGSDAGALVPFNAALDNRIASFPDCGFLEAHADYRPIAAANTFGRGASRDYVGRNQLDAATLNRFAVFNIDYDEALELAIGGNDEWTRHVQNVRAALEAEKIRHIVSPRASIDGAKLLAMGMDRATVADAVIWKGLDQTSRDRATTRMGSR